MPHPTIIEQNQLSEKLGQMAVVGNGAEVYKVGKI